MKRYLLSIIFIFWILNYTQIFADSYDFFYRDWCSHCANVEKYFDDNDILSKYDIKEKDIMLENDRLDFNSWIDYFWIKKVWVPTLYIYDENWDYKSYIAWDTPIINYFKNIENDNWNLDTLIDNENQEQYITSIDNNNQNWDKTSLKDRLKFFLILLPAAISDSINPCEFAVMLILLWSILIKYKDRKKVLISWLSFSLAIFLCYFLIWLWIFKVLWTFSSIFWLKLIVWVLWILIWLANLKDYFWYWKVFVMEVPFAWRKTMKKLLKWVTNPIWAFFVWVVVSLFLAPCTSWPYLVILWYLSSESAKLNMWWYIYLFIYNLFFILPMIIITLTIAFGKKSVDELEEFRDSKIELIHLIVGLLMLWLWIFVILQAYWIV